MSRKPATACPGSRRRTNNELVTEFSAAAIAHENAAVSARHNVVDYSAPSLMKQNSALGGLRDD